MQPYNYYLGDKQNPIDKYVAAKRIKLQQEQQTRGLDQRDRALDASDKQTAFSNDIATRQMEMAEGQASRAATSATQKVEAAKLKKAAIEQFSAKPNKTGADYAQMILEHPEMSEGITKSWDLLNTEAKRQKLETSSQIYAALTSGNPDVAKKLLKEQMVAAEAGDDKKAADGAKAMMMMVDQKPEAAEMSMGVFLASTEEGAKVIDKTLALKGGKRQQALHGGELQKQNAEILAKAQSLNLSRAQTNKVMVETRKLGMDFKKSVMEVEAMGKGGGIVADPEKRFNMEQKLRGEYLKQVGAFTETKDAYNRVNAAESTAVGDIALITSYMKMLDPGSTVREGEFATAQNAAGAGDKFRNTYNKILSGERLTEGQRKDFKSQGKALLDAAKLRDTEVRKGLAPTIKRYGLASDNIFYTKSEEDVAADKAESDPLGIRD